MKGQGHYCFERQNENCLKIEQSLSFFLKKKNLEIHAWKKTLEKREENNKMSGYAQLCGSFFMQGSLFMLATRHVLPNLCQNDFKWEWLVCFVEAMQ